jgi:hypothetical protein
MEGEAMATDKQLPWRCRRGWHRWRKWYRPEYPTRLTGRLCLRCHVFKRVDGRML